MKKLLFIIGLMILGTTIYAQETPNDIKRYDYKVADRYDGATYSVLTITDCLTNEKDYRLKIDFSFEENKIDYKCVLYYNEAVVAEMIKVFNYIVDTDFVGVKGEESFIICDVGSGAYFKYNVNKPHIDLMVLVTDDNNKERTRKLASIDGYEIGEFRTLLLKIEKVFAEKGRDLKDAVNSNDDKKEPRMIQL